jgi:hypothetical protein
MNVERTPVLIMGLLSFLFGCKNGTSTAQQPTDVARVELEEITARIDPQEGWADVFLKITEETKTDSSRTYTAKGLSKGRTVGLRFEVSTKIGAGLVDGEPAQNGFVANAVRIGSIGPESDDLVKALAELYKQPRPNTFTAKPISATAFSLNERAVDLDRKDQYKLKLFFGEDDESLYSEIFLNIDTDKREIELSEKDEGYREPLIKVLSR